MSYEFYIITTLLSIILFILCVIVQNVLPEIFFEDGVEKTSIKMKVNISDKRQSLLLFIGVIFILFTPIINWVISFVYSISVVYTGWKHRK